jgi:hypothetical protein
MCESVALVPPPREFPSETTLNRVSVSGFAKHARTTGSAEDKSFSALRGVSSVKKREKSDAIDIFKMIESIDLTVLCGRNPPPDNSYCSE